MKPVSPVTKPPMAKIPCPIVSNVPKTRMEMLIRLVGDDLPEAELVNHDSSEEGKDDVGVGVHRVKQIVLR